MGIFQGYLCLAHTAQPVDGPGQNDGGAVPAKTPLSEEISAALKKRGFKFVGPVIVYAWMQASGMVNDHDPRCFRRNLSK